MWPGHDPFAEPLEAHPVADVEQLVFVHGAMIAGTPRPLASHAHQVYLGAEPAITGNVSRRVCRADLRAAIWALEQR